MSKTFITDNLKTVHERIRAACERGHRDPNGVQLIDVSKTKPVEMLKEAYDNGERQNLTFWREQGTGAGFKI